MVKKVERPVGPVVDPLPVGNVPDMRPLHGRWIRLDHVSAAKHAADLYASFDGKDPDGQIWTYMAYGPFAAYDGFTEWLKAREAARDPWFYAFVRRDTARPWAWAPSCVLMPPTVLSRSAISGCRPDCSTPAKRPKRST